MLATATLESALHRLIAPARAMEVRVVRLDAAGAVLTAPLTANHNHAGTGFAGSLYSLACLTGWGWLFAHTRGLGHSPALLLADGQIRYERPCTGDLRADLRIPAEVPETVARGLQRGRRTRLELAVTLTADEQPVARFTGTYAALPDG